MLRTGAALVGVLLALISIPAHSQASHFLRDTVESWPEARRTPAISLLNQCRRAADSFVEIWIGGDIPTAYASTAKEFREQMSFDEFTKVTGVMRTTYGLVKAAEYRNESLMLGLSDTPDLLHAPHVQVVYAVTITKPSTTETFFEVYLSRDGGLCRVAGIRYQQYWSAIPWWLRKQEKEGSAAHDG